MASKAKTIRVTNGKVRVAVRDNEVVLNDFHETGPDVVAMARQAEEPEAAVHNALQVGARAIKLAEGSLDLQRVEKAFDGMSENLDRKLTEAATGIAETTEALLDSEDGALPQALGDFREELARDLDAAFDEDSKSSIIAKFDRLVRSLRQDERDAIRKLLDPGSDGSPLRRLKRDLIESVRDEAEGVRKVVGELAEKVAASEAAAEAFELTAVKGGSYEDLVHGVTSELVTPNGDVAAQTGSELGCSGNKKGDEVVALNPDDTRGVETSYTLEAKDRRLSLKATLDELDEAMANREAEAAIAVFSRAEYAPVAVPFAYFGDRAIVVLDKDEVDPTALRLATMWARWVVRRRLGAPEREIDVEAIERLIDEVAGALGRQTTIKRCHSTARKGIDQAAGHVAGLVREIEELLDQLREEID